jgi:hypothetical protein
MPLRGFFIIYQRSSPLKTSNGKVTKPGPLLVNGKEGRMLIKRILLVARISMLVIGLLVSLPAWATNLIENWDFSKGNTDFLTEFTYIPGNIVSAGTYDIVTDPKNSHWIACSYSDYTGDGNMMAVNGHTNHSIDVVWSQEVNVTPKRSYNFSFGSPTGMPLH